MIVARPRSVIVTVTVAAAALAAVIVTQVPAGSQETGATVSRTRTITVTSSATVSAAPDIATFAVSVRGEAGDGSGAFAIAARKNAAVIRALRDAGVAQRDLTTLSVGLNRQVLDPGQSSERIVYVASNRLEVIVRDLKEVGAAIDAAVLGGADAVANIRFRLEDPRAAQADALAEAMGLARAKADAIAGAAGTRVTGVVTVSDGRTGIPSLRSSNAYLGDLSADFATRILPPDELDSRVTVTVVWSVE